MGHIKFAPIAWIAVYLAAGVFAAEAWIKVSGKTCQSLTTDLAAAKKLIAAQDAKAKAALISDIPGMWHESNYGAPPSPCVVMDSLKVVGERNEAIQMTVMKWHARLRNQCDHPSPTTYVRLAFYDRDKYRHGFAYFAVETLKPGERSRLDNSVPRDGDVSAAVFAMSIDSRVALDWVVGE